MKTDFERERLWWDAKAPSEDRGGADELINQALRLRVIAQHLSRPSSVLDVGGATGRFSIPLAEQGHDVTHLDLSSEMLAIARKRASGFGNLRIEQGCSTDLSKFPDQTFDLVLNMDGAVSFCGAEARGAIDESCRVCKSTLILSVSHRARMIPGWITGSYKALGCFGSAADRMMEHGDWDQRQFADSSKLMEGCTQKYLGPLKSFLPRELRSILEENGMRVIRCGGLGSLAGLSDPESLERIAEDPASLEQFLDYCEYYDQYVMPDGPGTRQRAGLIAVAVRTKSACHGDR